MKFHAVAETTGKLVATAFANGAIEVTLTLLPVQSLFRVIAYVPDKFLTPAAQARLEDAGFREIRIN